MPAFEQLSASGVLRHINEGRCSAQEALEYFIDRYQRFNPDINAIVSADLEDARRRAREADEASARGECWGPLHGLPMTLKDNIETDHLPTSYGVADHASYQPPADADITRALKAAGAIVFGKTNMPAFGTDTQTFNDLYGQTNNPWDLSRTPGGSSGGAAAAVAAGLTPLEIGNDIGGSIRIPAHFCGLYGHKSSYGVVSGAGPKPWESQHHDYSQEIDLVVSGPLATSADDLALAMDVIVGPSHAQRAAYSIKLPSAPQASLADFTVGLWLDDPDCPVPAETGDVLQGFVDVLAAAGVNVTERKPGVSLRRAYQLRNDLDAATLSHTVPKAIYEWALGEAGKRAGQGEGPLSWMEAVTIRYRDWLALNRERLILRQQWQAYFENVDLLLCPVVPVPAHPHDHTLLRDRTIDCGGQTQPYWPVIGPWNSLALVSWLPATVIPAGFTGAGLPVGIQAVAGYLRDMTGIRFAQLVEREATGPFRRPGAYQ